MLIEVTQEDIDRGDAARTHSCAIARAVRRAFDVGFLDVDVERSTIVVNGCEWPTPPEAEAFIESFDEGCPVEPFSFELDDEIYCD